MDNHTLLQQFRYILSLASLAYTFATIHTLQYAMNNNNRNRNRNQFRPDHYLLLTGPNPQELVNIGLVTVYQPVKTSLIGDWSRPVSNGSSLGLDRSS